MVTGYSSFSEEVADALLYKEIEKSEIAKCLRKLKSSKTGGSDGIVVELLKYSGSGVVNLLGSCFQLYDRRIFYPGNGGRILLTLGMHVQQGFQ